MRIIYFASFNSHTNGFFLNDNILKFDDIIKTEQLNLGLISYKITYPRSYKCYSNEIVTSIIKLHVMPL